MIDDRTLTLIIRLLEECLEEEYSSEELRSKAIDMLRLLNGGTVSADATLKERRSAEAEL